MTQDRLIAALDVPDAVSGLQLADQIGDAVGFYKIGLGMLTGGGLALARELKDDRGKRVFLDMKLYDIGNTVAAAVRGLCRFDLDFLTVMGDPQVVSAATDAAAGSKTTILAVTFLTSYDRADMDAAMIAEGPVADLVVDRAARALQAGAGGVIASPHEAAAIRALPEADGKLIVTPGVRPAGSAKGDQKRIMTPSEAIRAGADHIVVGRPICAVPNPAEAARAIVDELRTL
jgi:orotidine-5'-phosphate decarboxylase